MEVPDICAYQDQCAKRRITGCYLALVKRKHVTRLDEKYLIVMAERRGLFGDTSPKKPKAKQPPKNARNEKEKVPPKIIRSFKATDISDLVRLSWSWNFTMVFYVFTFSRLIEYQHQHMLRHDGVISDINQRPAIRS